MNLPGHVAVAYLVGRRAAVEDPLAVLAPALFGALLPDLIDKPIWVLGLSPYGRTVGHSVLLWLGFALLVVLAHAARARRASALGWVLAGGASHFAVDLVDDVFEGFQTAGYAFSAWFGWPYTTPDQWHWRVPHLLERRTDMTTLLELATCATACALVIRAARARRRA